jgi:hypothetical protein
MRVTGQPARGRRSQHPVRQRHHAETKPRRSQRSAEVAGGDITDPMRQTRLLAATQGFGQQAGLDPDRTRGGAQTAGGTGFQPVIIIKRAKAGLPLRIGIAVRQP